MSNTPDHEVTINKNVGGSILKLLTEAIVTTQSADHPCTVAVKTPSKELTILIL